MNMRVNHHLATAALMAFVIVAASPTALAQSGPTLVPSTSDGSELNVTIPIFDPGIPDDPSVFRELDVFPRIRHIEAKLMPFLLRETLVVSGKWGAVRVATDPEAAAELQLHGTIIRSNGEWLELRIRAVDAAGFTWFDKVFSSQANDESSANMRDEGTPEFQAIYTEIAMELAAVRDRIGDAAVSNIKSTSLMLYARELAPSAFEGYLEQTDDGTLRVVRLPAREDPMLMRIENIRNTEFLITDTVDAKFREFNSDLARTYRVWRDYRRKVGDYDAWNTRFAQSKEGEFERGSWASIKHLYDSYKYDRITVQERDRLAVAFNTEVAATVAALEVRVAELTGWVEQGSIEWNNLLEQLYEVETNWPEQGN